MPETEESRAKKDKFINSYVGEAKGNGAEAARMAGYAASRAAITASELLKDPYVMKKLRTYQDLQKDMVTDGDLSIDEIFETVGPQALKHLAEMSKSDPDLAQKFMKLKLDYDKRKEEKLGEYEGLSTTELIRTVDTVVQEVISIKNQLMDATRAGKVPEQSDIPSEQSPGVR